MDCPVFTLPGGRRPHSPPGLLDPTSSAHARNFWMPHARGHHPEADLNDYFLRSDTHRAQVPRREALETSSEERTLPTFHLKV